MLPSQSGLDCLPPHPPTPPRDVGNVVTEAIEFLDDSNEIDNALARSSRENEHQYAIEDTPQSTPAPKRTKNDLSPVKKVGFSLSPVYAPVIPGSGCMQQHRPLETRNVNSRKLAKPLKSILKLQNQPVPPTPEELEAGLSYFSPNKPGTFNKMLQIVIHSLTGTSRTFRLDAYLSINAALKSSEGLPNKDELEKNMVRLQQFLARDISWKDEDGKVDVNIVQQALKLTATFLHDQRLSKALDDDFKVHLLDRSITVLESLEMPKIIVKHHAYLLGWQLFPAQLITPNKADKIISAFQTIEQRCSGNSVLDSRLITYQKLLDHQPNVMLTRMRDWIKPVVKGMFYPVQSIRERAIETCVHASLQLGEQPSASRILMEFFESRTIDDNGREFEDIVSRLNDMLSKKQNVGCVPQIWAALTLFLRSKRRSLDSWLRVQVWLRLIQRCLNSTDLIVKQEANRAWNQFVFTIMPDSSSSPKILEMLSLPITVGLQKKRSDKNAKFLQAFALNSLYNLLHYACRPGLSYAELDFAWDTYASAILMNSIMSSGTKGRQVACRILQGLFSPSAGVWDAYAAFQKDEIKPQGLPRIDPKWLRSRLTKVLIVVEPLVAATMCSGPDVATLVNDMWSALMQAIADAGSQEVRTSTELKEALVAVMGTLLRLWNNSPQQSADIDCQIHGQSDAWIRQFGTLVRIASTTVGASHFREEILTRSQDDEVKLAPTPSHRSSKHHYPTESPMLFVTRLFLSRSESITPSTSYFEEFNAILRGCVDINSTTASLHLLVKLQSALSLKGDTRLPISSDAPRIWISFARQAVDVLPSGWEKQNNSETHHLGQVYKDAISVLQEGLHLVSKEATLLPEVIQLFQAMLTSAKHSSGEGGAILAIVEPVSECLNQMLAALKTSTSLELATCILLGTIWPNNQSIECSREILWGVSMGTSRAASSQDPYEHLYIMICETLQECHKTWDSEITDHLVGFLSSVSSFLKTCPDHLILSTINKCQEGLIPWIGEPLVNVEGHCVGAGMVTTEITNMWQIILELLERLPGNNSALLQTVEAFLIAGLASKSNGVAIATLEYWNRTFGQDDALEYSGTLSDLLRSLRQHVNLKLPSLSVENDNNPISGSSANAKRREEEYVPNKEHSLRANRPVVEKPFLTRNKSVLQSPFLPNSASFGRTRSTQKALNLKLRHEDSQINFAPINENSPVGPKQDSQMLTEHQKEIRDRQREEVNMFPDLSSSPIFSSAAVDIHVHRRLDFTNTTNDRNECAGTPVTEGAASSDFLGSSPTPRATRHALHRAQQHTQHEECDGNASNAISPPSRDSRAQDSPTTSSTAQQSDPVVEAAIVDKYIGEDSKDGDNDAQIRTDLRQPNHCNFSNPNSELHQPHDQQSDISFRAPNVVEEDLADCDSSPIHYSRDDASEDNCFKETKESFNSTDESRTESVSRVEESFVARQSFEQEVTDTPNSRASETSQGRKRKRPGGHRRSSKKQKVISPFKRFFSSILGQSQEEKDDDESSIEDEIVVASSCPDESTWKDLSGTTNEESEGMQKLEGTNEIIRTYQMSEKPVKSGRGRPRKIQPPSPTPRLVAPAKKLKRKTSTLSQKDWQSQEQLSGVSVGKKINIAPPSVKQSYKQREGQDAKLIREAVESQTFQDSTNRRTAVAVVPSPPKQYLHAGQKRSWSEVDEPGESADPEKADTDIDHVRRRPMATPKSIFSRLKGVLDDLRNSILGSQEERQMDDLLFEIRRESYEAVRRGRDQD